jgi:hypothetical protein
MHIIIADGLFYTHVAGSSTLTNLPLPSGTSTVASVRPSFARYRRSVIVNGRFTPGLIYRDDLNTISTLGMSDPVTDPVIVGNGNSSTIDADILVRYTFSHESGGTLVHESNPSEASNEITLTNTGYTATLPTTAADVRVTHVRVYRSDNGGQFKFDGKVTLGTSTYSSTVATLSLGDALPYTTAGALNAYARGAPPYCTYVETYHDRMWYAGDPNYPQRVWYSRLGEPESVDNRDKVGDYIDTRDGEAVTSIKRCGDQLIVSCSTCTYIIQGYSDGGDGTGEADFTMVKISPSIGCIAAHSMVNVGGPTGGDMVYFAAQDGVWSYNGTSFKYMMKDLRTYWRDAYINDKANYEDCAASFDPYWNVYKLLIPATASSFYYIGHVLPMAEGAPQPDWTFDVRGRRDYSVGVLSAASSQFFESYTGSCDGYLRKENVDSVGDDDGVDKVIKIRTKHYYFGGISGSTNHGFNYGPFDFYGKHENTAVTLDFYAGDDYAGDAVTPQRSFSVAATAVSTFNAVSASYHPLVNVTGRGFTHQTRSTNPVGLEWNGFGISFQAGAKGVNTRMKVT